MPLSVSIFEFNEGSSSHAGRQLAGLLSAYNRSLLSVTAQAIRLESDIKNGYATFGDMVIPTSRRLLLKSVCLIVFVLPEHLRGDDESASRRAADLQHAGSSRHPSRAQPITGRTASLPSDRP